MKIYKQFLETQLDSLNTTLNIILLKNVRVIAIYIYTDRELVKSNYNLLGTAGAKNSQLKY